LALACRPYVFKKRKEKKKRKEVILVGVELAHLALY
jgi:hypothetical protein